MGWICEILRIILNWIRKCKPCYEPDKWNDVETLTDNNCYNYGCDIETDTFAQPGRAHGQSLTRADLNNCTKTIDYAVLDGLKVFEEKGDCEGCCHKVAMVIWPNVDYHWYRMDRDGKWSHKPGPTQATNLDNSGNIITDPQTANRGGYTVFCGYFCVCKKEVSIN
jgi:hypothetical protein